MQSNLTKWLFLVLDKLFDADELPAFLTSVDGKLVSALPSPVLLSEEAWCMDAADLLVRRGFVDAALLARLQELDPNGLEIEDLMLAIAGENAPRAKSLGGPKPVVRQSADLQGERIEAWTRLLDQELFAVGTSFHRSVPNIRDILAAKALAGARLRYLFFDPESEHLALVATGFGQTEPELRAELTQTAQALTELRASLPEEARANLQIRTYNAPPQFRMYGFDPTAGKGTRAIVVPYKYGVDSPQLPAFEADVDHHLEQAEQLWAEARVLE